MTLTWTNYTSFESVVAHYEDIKPIRERTLGTSRDIRPIGDRNRKQERIVKLSRNCYALSDGYHRGDGAFTYFSPSWGRGLMEYYAPIVWRKHKDGSESVRIMNMTGPDYGSDITRYSFIDRHTPQGLHFIRGNARQYISASPTWGTSSMHADKIFLAKGKTVPAEEYKDKQGYLSGAAHKYEVTHGWAQRKDDNAALVFEKYGSGNWVHNTTTGKGVPNGPHVNKELKAQYKDALKKFFQWGMIMSPLIPLQQDYIMERIDEIRKHFHPHVTFEPWKPEWSREVISDADHPMRLQLWIMFASQTHDGWGYSPTYAVKAVQTEDDLRRVRARFNSFINTNAGFMKE